VYHLMLVQAAVEKVQSVQTEVELLAVLAVLAQMSLLLLAVAHYLRLLVVAVQVTQHSAQAVRQSVATVEPVELTQPVHRLTQPQAEAVQRLIALLVLAVAVLSM
jgi:hypothetical protein